MLFPELYIFLLISIITFTYTHFNVSKGLKMKLCLSMNVFSSIYRYVYIHKGSDIMKTSEIFLGIFQYAIFLNHFKLPIKIQKQNKNYNLLKLININILNKNAF